MENKIKLSFIIPTYNRADLARRAINSVLLQPYSNKEIIVVDDGSEDKTSVKLQDFVQQKLITLISLSKNYGQNKARNVGIRAATGEIITILDSDDEDSNANLHEVISIFEAKPYLTGVFTPVIFKSTGHVLRSKNINKVFGAMGFVDGTYSGEHQAFLKKSVLPKHVFEENLDVKRSCTLITWIKLGLDNQFLILPTPTKIYHDEGLNRFGNKSVLIRDSAELARCNELILEMSGEFILKNAPKFYFDLKLKQSFYELIAFGRLRALNTLRSVDISHCKFRFFVFLHLMIILGGRAAALVRRVL